MVADLLRFASGKLLTKFNSRILDRIHGDHFAVLLDGESQNRRGAAAGLLVLFRMLRLKGQASVPYLKSRHSKLAKAAAVCGVGRLGPLL